MAGPGLLDTPGAPAATAGRRLSAAAAATRRWRRLGWRDPKFATAGGGRGPFPGSIRVRLPPGAGGAPIDDDIFILHKNALF